MTINFLFYYVLRVYKFFLLWISFFYMAIVYRIKKRSHSSFYGIETLIKRNIHRCYMQEINTFYVILNLEDVYFSLSDL